MTKQTIIKIALIVTFVLIISALYFVFTTKKQISSSIPAPVASQSQSDKRVEDKNEFYNISAQYPDEKHDTGHVIEHFITSATDKKKEEWKIGGLAYAAEKQIAKSFPDRPMTQYQYSITYKKYESKRLGTVSYLFTTYEFIGGANGNITVNSFTFNDKGLLTIDLILDFSNYKDIALTKALADEIIKKDGDQATPDMVLDGLGFSYLKGDGKTIDKKKCQCDGFLFPSNFQNFIVEEDGLRFFFNKYQIAPGSAGIPEILLPWKFLSPYMQSTFVVQ